MLPVLSFAGSEIGRTPIPPESKVAEAVAVVRSGYKTEYTSAAKKGDPRPLLLTLAQAARETKVDERKYALLEEAERLAIEADLYTLALNIAKEKALTFDVSVLPARLKVLEKCSLSRSVDVLEQGLSLAETSIAIALNDEDFSSARAALKTMRVVVDAYIALEEKREKEVKKKYPRLFSKNKQPTPVNTTQTETDAPPPKPPQRRFDYFTHRYKQRFEELYNSLDQNIKIAEERYAAGRTPGLTKGGDEEALLPGKYLCFDKLDWEKGLKLLSNATGPLGDAVRCELALGKSPSPDELMKAAGEWWEYSELISDEAGVSRSDVAAVQSHAVTFYVRVKPQLVESFDIRLAEKRIRESLAPRVILDIETEAAACDSASDSVQLYQMYLARPTLSPSVKTAAEGRLACWKERDDENYQRYGSRWIAREERDDHKKRSEQLMLHGFELLRLGKNELAKAEFDAASETNESSGEAEFYIGWIYALIAYNDLLAIEHFQEGLRREPGNEIILLSLANCELLAGRCEDALRHYRDALEKLDDQAIATCLLFAVQNSDRLKIRDDLLDRFSGLYRRAIQELGLRVDKEKQPRLTFLLPPNRGWDNNDKKGKDDASRSSYADAPAVSIGTGSGFVVAPGYIVTNQHVVEGCSEILIIDPANRERKYQAKVIASQSSPDLALLEIVYDDKEKVEEKAPAKGRLTAPPLILADRLPDRGEDIMALGFPAGTLLGLELKATKGAVVSLGDPTFEGSFLHSCIINPGNSGGPIVNQYGELIGVVVAIVKTSSVGTAYSIGIPVELVREFLDKHLPSTAANGNPQASTTPPAVPAAQPQPKTDGDSPNTPGDSSGSPEEDTTDKEKNRPLLSWPKVDAKVSPSTVFIQGKKTE